MNSQPEKGISSIYDGMTTKQLEEILSTLDASLQEDCVTIEKITGVIIRREHNNPAYGLPDVNDAWKEFHQYYMNADEEDVLDLLGEETGDENTSPSNPAEVMSKPKHKKRPIIRWAVIASIVALIGLNTFTVAAYGVSLAEAFAIWTDDFFSFTSAPSSHEIVPSEINSEYEYLNEFGADFNFLPTWLPEGFEFDRVLNNSSPSSHTLLFYFVHPDEPEHLSLSAIKRISQDLSIIYEKDSESIDIITLDDIPHYIYSNLGNTVCSWQVKNYEFSIQGPVSREDMNTIINSIYEKVG